MRVIPAIALAVLVTLVPRAAEAQAVIYACYVKNSGTMYRIKAVDPAETCKTPQHVEFHWNVEGPAGDDGVDGASGISGYERVQRTEQLDPVCAGSAFARCTGGKRVLAGGYQYLPACGGNRGEVFSQGPQTSGGDDGWIVSVLREHNIDPGTGQPTTLTAYAICAYVTE